MPDVRLFQTADGGNIRYDGGRVELHDGLETASFLSMFGGNRRDSGAEGDDHLEWWGNKGETEQARRYRSETQYLLLSLPLVPGNLRRIEGAAERDHEWMVSEGLVEAVRVSATMPGVNRVHFTVFLTVDNTERRFDFDAPKES